MHLFTFSPTKLKLLTALCAAGAFTASPAALAQSNSGQNNPSGGNAPASSTAAAPANSGDAGRSASSATASQNATASTARGGAPTTEGANGSTAQGLRNNAQMNSQPQTNAAETANINATAPAQQRAVTQPATTQAENPSGAGFTSDDAVSARGDADDAVDTAPATRTLEVNRTEAADRTAVNEGAMYFSEVDNSNDYRLTWDEVRTSYEQEVLEMGWSREEFFNEFDTDSDEFLDEDEYSEFISDIGLEEPENRSSFIDID